MNRNFALNVLHFLQQENVYATLYPLYFKLNPLTGTHKQPLLIRVDKSQWHTFHKKHKHSQLWPHLKNNSYHHGLWNILTTISLIMNRVALSRTQSSKWRQDFTRWHSCGSMESNVGFGLSDWENISNIDCYIMSLNLLYVFYHNIPVVTIIFYWCDITL